MQNRLGTRLMPAPCQIVFAHHSTPVPAELHDYGLPRHRPIETLSDRQINKWKSRRVAYFLLQQLLEQYQYDPRLIEQMARTPSGRPYLPHCDIDFNISHSGEWVAVIFSCHRPKKVVGIDIEQPLKPRRYQDLLAYYASPQEIAEMADLQILPQLAPLADRFYLSWCLREAVLKSQGVGIIKLSEVQHSLKKQIITSAHCPQGWLGFIWQLPFYLAYFFEPTQSMLSLPPISQWRAGRFELITPPPTLIYQVN